MINPLQITTDPNLLLSQMSTSPTSESATCELGRPTWIFNFYWTLAHIALRISKAPNEKRKVIQTNLKTYVRYRWVTKQLKDMVDIWMDL